MDGDFRFGQAKAAGYQAEAQQISQFSARGANREAAHPADSSRGVWNFRRRPNRSVRWIRFR